MNPEFDVKHKTWLNGHLDNPADRLMVALAVSVVIPLPWLVRLRVRDIWQQERMRLHVPITRRRKHPDIRLPITETMSGLVAAQVSGRPGEDWLFPGPHDGHITAKHARKVLDTLGLFGDCGRETIRNHFGVAVHVANGREVTDALRRSDLWLWSDQDFVDDGVLRAGATAGSGLHCLCNGIVEADLDKAWRLIHRMRWAEAPDQRLLSAQYFVRTIFWVTRSEGEAIGKILARDYRDVLFDLWRSGYLEEYSLAARGAEAAAAARPRNLQEFWADVPEHLQLKALIPSQ